ncbi:hypothetical protein AeMF1_020426 [Aphanomyces euteiches]|nr:hypothetical protein AeMF1_020426 [Aphanomyces euteiches]KAH9183451.1 hypothetical protein AeNC1_014574 [Aphanomyces euteiches]
MAKGVALVLMLFGVLVARSNSQDTSVCLSLACQERGSTICNRDVDDCPPCWQFDTSSPTNVTCGLELTDGPCRNGFTYCPDYWTSAATTLTPEPTTTTKKPNTTTVTPEPTTTTSSPTTATPITIATTTSPSTVSPSLAKSSNAGYYALAGIGGALVVVAGAWFVVRARRKKQKPSENSYVVVKEVPKTPPSVAPTNAGDRGSLLQSRVESVHNDEALREDVWGNITHQDGANQPLSFSNPKFLNV